MKTLIKSGLIVTVVDANHADVSIYSEVVTRIGNSAAGNLPTATTTRSTVPRTSSINPKRSLVLPGRKGHRPTKQTEFLTTGLLGR